MINRRWMDTKEAGNSCTIGSKSESVSSSGATLEQAMPWQSDIGQWQQKHGADGNGGKSSEA